MALTKTASAEVLGIKGGNSKTHREASLDKFADFNDFRTEDGYLYARIRAISSRVNKNHDGWPSVELAGGEDIFNKIAGHRTGHVVAAADDKAKFGYSTFLGKPIFVDHHNSDPSRARGVIVDAKLHVEDDDDPYYKTAADNHKPATWVELLLEVDAKSFPKLAAAIIEGSENSEHGIDGFSMGCDVRYSKCSHCGNKASSPDQYCEHIRLKGAEFPFHNSKTGKTEYKKSYEDCYEIGFFEISAVFDPADETALLREIHAHTAAENPVTHTAEAPPPQVDELKMPEAVDTLREETVCPVCGSDMDDETCQVCGYTKPPDEFDNPDLTKANPDAGEQDQEAPPPGPEDEAFGPPVGETSPPSGTSNQGLTANVSGDMSWTVSTTHTAATKETPVVPNAQPASDEPKNATIVQDHTQPVTSNVRTAENFLAAVDAQRRTMSQQHTAYDAPGAPESATPDKNIDVDGVGGIMEPSNEEASKADAQIDVVGVGTTGTSDVAADKTESVDQGDEHSKNVEAIPTKTWNGEKRQHDPVTNEVYPSSGGVTSSWSVTALDSDPYPHDDGGLAGGPHVEGTEPADPVGKADERVDVQEAVTSPENNSGETKTWSGTDGNKVYRQQDPVTNETLEGDELVNLSPGTVSSAHIFAAMKLADTEVEMGLTPKADKFERAAELEKLSPEELQAESRVVARVKTAGLSRQTRTAMRVPAIQHEGSVLPESRRVEAKEAEESEDIPDSALFS